jgi:hypothetical protein
VIAAEARLTECRVSGPLPAIWDAPVVISGRVFWDGWVRRDLVLPKLGRSA